MDKVSSNVRLVLSSDGWQDRPLDCSASSSNPMMEGPWCRFRREARARGRHRYRKVDSLKALDPERPIREADIATVAPINGHGANDPSQTSSNYQEVPPMVLARMPAGGLY